MAYIGSSPTKVVSRQSANIFTYTATANQTAFTGSDANGNTLACSPSDLMVHMNGIKLEESDYTATTTTVTLGSGAAAGDEVTITAFLTFESADHYTKSAADTRYVNTTGDTMTGNLTVSGGLVSATGTSTLTNPEADLGLYHSFKNLSSDINTGVGISLGSNNNGGATIYAQRTGANNEHKLGFSVRNNSGSSLTRMAISGSGFVTKPYQPAFMAYGSGTYANRGNGAIEYSTAVFNQGNHYSTSTYTFTAPVSGVYHFSAGAIAHATSTASGGIFIEKNSTHLFKDYQETGTRNRTVSGTAYCAANDAIKVRIESSGSGGDYYYLGAGYGWFSGHLVG